MPTKVKSKAKQVKSRRKPLPVPLKAQADIYAMRARIDSGELGLRERHKVDKLSRISEATQLLFSRHGYEGTTLREIAKQAGVALGTLSLYATDKRDLIVLLFNKVVPPLLVEARSQTFGKAKLADNMVTFFEPFYRAYANNVQLYRIILGHIYSSTPSVHAQEFIRIRAELTNSLSDLILRARASGECSGEGDLGLQSTSFFYLYFASVRWWLAGDNPNPAKGMAALRELFDLHVRGLKRAK